MTQPRAGATRFQAALAFHNAGRFAEALLAYDDAIAIDPAYVDAHSNRGIVLFMLGRTEAAVDSFGAAAAINPGYAEAHFNQALALAQLERWSEAIAAYDRTLAADPRHLTAAVNRGLALAKTNRHVDAIEAFDRALEISPDIAVVHCRRAYSLLALLACNPALAGFEAALAIDPNHVESLFFKGETLIKLGQLEAALPVLDAALALEPDRADILDRRLSINQYLIDWDAVTDDLARLAALGDARGTIGAFSLLAVSDDPALHRHCAQLHSAVIGNAVGAAARPPARPVVHPAGDRLRIGYFSADFHGHATMHLIAEMLEAHDRDRFEINLFSFGASIPDAWNARARSSAEHFFDLRYASEAEIAAASRAQKIDIAVDLKGDTAYSRQGIFAERAAPLQVHYLGYPGTMAADWFDYIVVDPIVVPDSAQGDYSEKRLILPDCYQPNCRDRAINRVPVSRADFGLGQGFVFACFNQGYKITAPVFDVWMAILGDVPESQLWLWVENDTARGRLRSVAAARGIDPDRLVFAAALPPEHQLNRMPLADRFLDTSPYGAHTTGSDALRMGVPVVTCPGRSFASRVASSLVAAVGMPELSTADWPSYRALAVALARDPDRLATVRARLVSNLPSAPLFDPVRLVRHLENGFVAIDARHRQGFPPIDIHL